jgi:hypothetical protein
VIPEEKIDCYEQNNNEIRTMVMDCWYWLWSVIGVGSIDWIRA